MKGLILLLLIILLLVVGLRGVAKIYEPLLLFHPDLSLELTPQLVGMEALDAPIRSGDRWLHGWLIKADSNRYAVFFHGNAGNISDRLEFIKAMAPLKMNILLFDYQGYGRSEGIPTIAGIEQDAVAAVDFLHEKGRVPYDRILLWGRSLGGAAALAAAEARPEIGGVIVESSFLSLRRIANDLYPYLPTAFVTDGFRNDRRVGVIDRPKLFIHGTADTLIPVAHTQELYGRATEPKKVMLIKGGGHDDGYIVGGAEYIASIAHWLDTALGPLPE